MSNDDDNLMYNYQNNLYLLKNILIFYNNNYKLHVMDIFQLIGDFLHLIAVLMLLLKIAANKNVIGI